MPELRVGIRHKIIHAKVDGEKTFREDDYLVPLWIEGAGEVAIYVGQDRDDMKPNSENPFSEDDLNLFFYGADYLSFSILSGNPKIIVPKGRFEIVKEDLELFTPSELAEYTKNFRVET